MKALTAIQAWLRYHEAELPSPWLLMWRGEDIAGVGAAGVTSSFALL